uniref:Uncharacterized protein n=1 Tax=uncultured prokaryote TaxID=198431 RepID=A0A0H5QJL6_9ZZZZ|nr:hypothetical protein [uncultured prokaryote]
MTVPPSPLAYALDTIREVRSALAHVPALCARSEWDAALDVVGEQLVQLEELKDDWAALGSEELDQQLALVSRTAHRARQAVIDVAAEHPELAPGAHQILADPLSFEDPDDWGDQPLW